jgi:hypothetical protein
LPRRIADGPTFAHGITKTQLNQEWAMGLEQAIEAEAQAQAICMQTATSNAPTRPSSRSKNRCSRAIESNGRPQLSSAGRSSTTATAITPKRLEALAAANLPGFDHHDVDAACRELVIMTPRWPKKWANGGSGWLDRRSP